MIYGIYYHKKAIVQSLNINIHFGGQLSLRLLKSPMLYLLPHKIHKYELYKFTFI